MSAHAKTLVIALIIMCLGSWLVMELGPRVLSKSRSESPDQVEAFAQRACQAIVGGDHDAYRELLVRPADVSADNRYGWLPYSGAQVEEFTEWTQRALAQLTALDRSGVSPTGCGKVVAVAKGETPNDLDHRRVLAISVEVAAGNGPARVLDIGPSVMSARGRVLQGARDGTFARWRD